MNDLSNQFSDFLCPEEQYINVVTAKQTDVVAAEKKDNKKTKNVRKRKQVLIDSIKKKPHNVVVEKKQRIKKQPNPKPVIKKNPVVIVKKTRDERWQESMLSSLRQGVEYLKKSKSKKSIFSIHHTQSVKCHRYEDMMSLYGENDRIHEIISTMTMILHPQSLEEVCYEYTKMDITGRELHRRMQTVDNYVVFDALGNITDNKKVMELIQVRMKEEYDSLHDVVNIKVDSLVSVDYAVFASEPGKITNVLKSYMKQPRLEIKNRKQVFDKLRYTLGREYFDFFQRTHRVFYLGDDPSKTFSIGQILSYLFCKWYSLI